MEACQPFYIAAGFADDCATLISEFEETSTSSFQEFSVIWNEMKFSLVFTQRSSKSELTEFCEETLSVAKDFLSTSKKLKEKIGGIYLLYGLYFRMPIDGPKIRMTKDEWEIMTSLQQELLDHHAYEAVFILNELIRSCAFSYCRTEHERGLENYYVLRDFVNGKSRPLSTLEKEKDLLKTLSDIEKESEAYMKIKNHLGDLLEGNIPKLFKIEEIKKLVNEVRNQNDIDDQQRTPGRAKKGYNLRSCAVLSPTPSTSHESSDNSQQIDDDRIQFVNVKKEFYGDSESSDDSMDSDY